MKVARLAAVAIVLGGGGATSGAVSSSAAPNPSEVEAHLSVQLDEVAKALGITRDEASRSLEENGPIGAFNERFHGDPRFGAVWVTSIPSTRCTYA